MTISYSGLLVVAVAAFVAPLLARAVPRRLVPAVVLEVLAGIAVGPQGLNLVQPRGAAELLYLLGLGFLLFLAGQDVRPERFRGPTFRLAGLAFLVSGALAVPTAFALRLIAPGADVRLLALCLVASTLGVLVPVLRDAGEIATDFGQLVVVAGSVGEFGSLLLLTILFSAQPESTTVQVIYVLAMAAAAVLLGVLLKVLWRTRWMAQTFADSDEDTTQLRVRGAFVVLLVFTALAHEFGVDALLGAFIAGMVVAVSDGDERPSQERYQAKLRAIGYGFLVPVFFVMTGVQFDVRALFAHASALALVPLLVLAIAVVRGGPGPAVPAPARAAARAGRWPAAGHHAHVPGRGGRARAVAGPAQRGGRGRADRCVAAVCAAVPGRRAVPPPVDPDRPPGGRGRGGRDHRVIRRCRHRGALSRPSWPTS